MSFFVIRQGNSELGWIELSGNFSVGRQPLCDLVLHDAMISRNHFQFEKEGDQWFVLDLGSKNGTFLDDRQVIREALGEGDVVVAGKYAFEFYEGAPTGKKYTPLRAARPADPREAMQGTMQGVVFSEAAAEERAEIPRRRPRPQPRIYPTVGLLEEEPANQPQEKPRIPILLELPGEDELAPIGETLRRPPAPVGVEPDSGKKKSAGWMNWASGWRINLDFAAFVVILALLTAGAFAIRAFIPHW